MRLALILLTLILINSCGKEAEPVQGCNTSLAAASKVWTSDSTNIAYDVRNCTAGVTCELTFDGTCDQAGEIRALFNDGGGIAYETCNDNVTYSGNWRVCSNVLEFYNMSGNANETFR